jgi:hypothetical protein
VFKEDESLITEGFAPENPQAINLLVARMLKAEKTCKNGLEPSSSRHSLTKSNLCRVLEVSEL